MIRISFLGDISFNNEYIRLCHSGTNPFTELQFLKDSDFVIGNLECLSKGSDGVNQLKNPRLQTDADTFAWLNDLNVSHVSLANNHVYDNLENGFLRTTRKLEELGIQYWGCAYNSSPKKFIELNSNGVNVGVLTYLDSDTNPNIPEGCKIQISYLNEQIVIDDIKEFKSKCDILILYLHWGGRSENLIFPDKKQIGMSQRLTEAGADYIIGHHSHTIQPSLSTKSGTTFFSLGNFCFSDIVMGDEIIRLSKSNKHGLILTLEIDNDCHVKLTKAYVKLTIDKVYIQNDLAKQYSFINNMFNFIVKHCLDAVEAPIYFNKFIAYPIKYLLRGNVFEQLKKINLKKIKGYLK